MIDFNREVVQVCSHAWGPSPNSTCQWDLWCADNQHNRLAAIINLTLEKLETGDPAQYLLYMALLGNLFLFPKPLLSCGSLAQMQVILEFYRCKVLRCQRGLPIDYPSEGFIVKCLVLGACFLIKCGLGCLAEGELALSTPIMHWERLSPEAQHMWLQNVVVFYQVVATHAFGDYVEATTHHVPEDPEEGTQ